MLKKNNPCSKNSFPIQLSFYPSILSRQVPVGVRKDDREPNCTIKLLWIIDWKSINIIIYSKIDLSINLVGHRLVVMLKLTLKRSEARSSILLPANLAGAAPLCIYEFVNHPLKKFPRYALLSSLLRFFLIFFRITTLVVFVRAAIDSPRVYFRYK